MPITPDYISGLVNFQSNTLDKSWSHDPEGTDMRNLQVKGAARVFNLLESYRLALLADEVGMGKTIQALTICSALWREKPQARVLILAPRDEIARNWEKEYLNFIRHHYRHEDNIVKSISGEEPVKRMIYCPNLFALVHEIKQGWGQLFIGKISSFSSLMSKKEVVGRLSGLGIRRLSRVRELGSNPDELNLEIARLLKAEIVQQSENGKPYFDLLIIDEAHYFRNSEGGTLRAGTAKVIFGDPTLDDHLPLASKVLLMTATPNHSSSKDIGNIVGYFTRRFQGKPYTEILDALCVRRLRRLSSRGVNKYNYRHEIPSPSTFKEDPLGEMCFGLYQHELARELNKTRSERAGKRGVSRMMKYLEGVEFIPFEKEERKPEGEEEKTGNSSDYRKGEDAGILLAMSKRFYEIFDSMPRHPKYDKLVRDLTEKSQGEKCVVFVRRIPSVFEIAKRVIEYYDKSMWKVLQTGPLAAIPYEKLSRRDLKASLTSAEEEDNEQPSAGTEVEQEGNIPSCKVLSLFRVVKNDKVKATDASNFRLRFNHSKANVFAMFFSPAADYFKSEYTSMILHRFDVGRDELENYHSSALLHRLNSIDKEPVRQDLKSMLLPKNPASTKGEVPESLPTLLTIFWGIFLPDEAIPAQERVNVEQAYHDFSYYEREAFSNFLEKGVLLASEAVVWFYREFRQVQEGSEDSQVKTYLEFCRRVERELKEKRLYLQIRESILHFKSMYTKVFSINSNRALLEESWESFGSAQPIYPYNADNSSQKVLKCFNTPFYPDMLVATSVLQEGVNLQFFCNTVYHYGMAWTPGDNEQRIGRIDRMFGKIERNLEVDERATLDIYYPYLKDTVDEEHLGRFAKRKYNEEVLIDRGKAFEEGADFALEENDNDSWKQFLRKPVAGNVSDPFPVHHDHFKGIQAPKLKQTETRLDEFYGSIINSLEQLSVYSPKIYYVRQESSQKLLVDPTMADARKQPVIVELLYDHVGSGYRGESVYCLRMRTPLASSSKFRDRRLRTLFLESAAIQELYKPGTKFCLDPSQTGGGSWGLYMAHELPLFLMDLKDNPLSSGEVQQAFVQLIHCADEVEKVLFNQDLQTNELNLPMEIAGEATNQKLREVSKHPGQTSWRKEGIHLVLEHPLEAMAHEPLKEAAIANHENFYARVFRRNDGWIAQVAIPEKDAQEEELEILKKHLDVYVNKRRWLRQANTEEQGFT